MRDSHSAVEFIRTNYQVESRPDRVMAAKCRRDSDEYLMPSLPQDIDNRHKFIRSDIDAARPSSEVKHSWDFENTIPFRRSQTERDITIEQDLVDGYNR